MLLISEELRDGLLNYLMTRPCQEVIHGVLALQNLSTSPSAELPTETEMPK